MYRKTKCSICEYEQETFVSYYAHKKLWDKNHNLENCLSVRRSQNAFDKMFSESLDTLAKLSIIR